VKKFTKIVVPVVSAAAAATAAPAPPPRVVVHVAPSSRPAAARPPERVVMVPPSIMPGNTAWRARPRLAWSSRFSACSACASPPCQRSFTATWRSSRIRRSGRAYGGEGLAIAGLVLGYFFIAISIILAVSYGMIASVFAPLIEQAARKGG